MNPRAATGSPQLPSRSGQAKPLPLDEKFSVIGDKMPISGPISRYFCLRIDFRPGLRPEPTGFPIGAETPEILLGDAVCGLHNGRAA